MLYTFAETTPYEGATFTKNGKLYGYEVCGKCDGVGTLWWHMNVSNGVCFACGGEKKRKARLYSERENASQRRRIERAIAQEKSRAAINMELAALRRIRGLVQDGLRNIARGKANAASAYVGAIGDRIQIEATVKFCMGFDGFYGTTYINTMVDAAGNIFVYKGKRLASKGDTICLKATIKDHSDYKGAKQTVLSRPSIINS